jgi:hypothetical protein
MYPHERSLVSRLEGKPFALLGVNSDPSREQLKRVSAVRGLTWRSWWDGSTDGPIARRWKVESWPTLFVLDGKGVIRHRVSNAADLDRAVDRVLRETESGGGA